MIKDIQSLLDQSNASTEAQPPVALTGRELQELLSPISGEDFAKSYFSRLSLYVKGHPEKFEHVFNWESLKRALSSGRNIEDQRFNVKASYASGEESGSSKPMFDANISQVGELLTLARQSASQTSTWRIAILRGGHMRFADNSTSPGLLG